MANDLGQDAFRVTADGYCGVFLGKQIDPVNGVVTFSNTKSLLLDGVDEYVNIDSVRTALASTTVGTISLWMKAVDATPASNEELITFGDTNGAYYIRFMFIGGTGRLTASLANVTEQWRLDLDDALSDNTWYHIALVHTGTDQILYVNGSAVNQAHSTTTDKTQWFNDISAQLDNGRIGCLNFNSGGNTNHFNGNIDEVVFTNDAKSAADILAIYNSGAPKDESSISNGVSYFRMGDADGDNYNSGVANEWQFIDQIGSNNASTVNCEEADVETDTP